MRDIDEGSKSAVKEVRNVKTKVKKGITMKRESKKARRKERRSKIKKMRLIKGRKEGED
jgi:hypothetical protein